MASIFLKPNNPYSAQSMMQSFVVQDPYGDGQPEWMHGGPAPSDFIRYGLSGLEGSYAVPGGLGQMEGIYSTNGVGACGPCSRPWLAGRNSAALGAAEGGSGVINLLLIGGVAAALFYGAKSMRKKNPRSKRPKVRRNCGGPAPRSNPILLVGNPCR